MHIGGDLVMRPRLSYKNGIVEYFDHFNCDEGSILDLRRMVKQLRFCDKKVQFWYKYGNTKKPKVMKLSSDADILGLITDIPKNKELDIYVEHHYDDQWDYEVEIDRKLGDDTLMYDEVESEDDISSSVGEEFVEVEGVDVRDTATSSHGQGLDGLGKQNEEFAEVECNLSEQVLRSLCDSDSDEGVSGPVNVFEERNLKKEGFKFVTGMVFNSAREFKWAVEYHEALRHKDFKLLNDYCEELMRSNPGTTIKMKLDSEFIVNGRPRIEEMSSQPSQSTGGANAIRTVSDFIAANEPTSTTKKYITVGGIRYSYSEAYLIRK
nr:uncharacterized protein LOC109168401 [Ipomoea batatas]